MTTRSIGEAEDNAHMLFSNFPLELLAFWMYGNGKNSPVSYTSDQFCLTGSVGLASEDQIPHQVQGGVRYWNHQHCHRIWRNSYNTLLYSSKVKWSWSMCLFYSQCENISPRHIFLFFIPIALFIFPTLYLYILLIRCRKNLQIIVSSLVDPAHR